MREIEFRGIRKDNGEWVYGYYWKSDTKHYIRVPQFQPNEYEWIDYEVIPETVGQFTGLHDKEGVEIYEGDKTNHGVVEWLETRLMWVLKIDSDCFMSIVHFSDLEVIGNIHTPPKLLEQK